MSVTVGQLAPDFTLLDHDGNPVTLSALRGQRVVIFFYPKADTPGCTIQACGFRDRWAEIRQADGLVLGISPDTSAELAVWREKEGFPYPLLADSEHRVAEAYGVWGEKTMFGRTFMGVVRSHFVISADGVLEAVERNISPQDSVEKAVTLLTS